MCAPKTNEADINIKFQFGKSKLHDTKEEPNLSARGAIIELNLVARYSSS